jgi:tetratricopeptide (TPR) repeat protein
MKIVSLILLILCAVAFHPASALNKAELLQRAVQLEREGDHRKAIRLLLDGRKKLGEPDLFSWELARLYIQQADYPRAIDAILLLLRQTPQRYPAVERYLLTQMADETASSEIMRGLEDAFARERADDGDLQQLAQLAQLASACALERNDAGAGLRILEELPGTPENADLLFQYASRCETRGQDATAADAYALFTERRPDSPYLYQALLRRAAITVRSGDHARAAALYSQLIQRYPGRPEVQEALCHLGRLQLEELGDLKSARASLETVLQSPHRSQSTNLALELLAEIELREGDLKEAEKHLNRLQSRYSTRLRHAELRYFRTDFNGAQQILEELLAKNSAHPLANDAIDLLLLCDELQDQESALEHFPRAQLLERQQRTEEAAEEWAWLAANASPPIRQLSLLSRARTRQKRGEKDASLALYKELVSLFPTGRHAVEASLRIAALREEREEFETALKRYETALLAAPDDARVPEIRLHIQRLRARLADGGS